jgi:hypothetical protein
MKYSVQIFLYGLHSTVRFEVYVVACRSLILLAFCLRSSYVNSDATWSMCVWHCCWALSMACRWRIPIFMLLHIIYNINIAVPSSSADWSVVLQLIVCWDRRFESSWRREYSYLVFVLCCLGSGLCDGLISRPEKSYRVCLCLLRPSNELCCCATENKNK